MMDQHPYAELIKLWADGVVIQKLYKSRFFLGRNIMKMMIEVDIPAGRSVAEAQGVVKQFFDPDWISSWWHIDDVKEQYMGDGEYSEITDEEAREVLRLADKYHDCEVGLNWEVLDSWVDHVKSLRPESESLKEKA